MRSKILRNLFIGLCCWILGYCLLTTISANHTQKSTNKIELNPKTTDNTYIWSWNNACKAFLKIAYTNIFVAFLLSFVGFYTGGLLSLVILLFNGFMLKMAIIQLPDSWNDLYIASYFWHAPFEIIAFSWFGAIGMLGFTNIRKLFNNETLDLKTPNQLSMYINPLILLLIADIIESLQFAINLTIWI